jgi:hypothetical protein
MDVEGAEYEIIPHMAEMRAWSVVDYLLVEWHPWALKGGNWPEEIALVEERAKAALEKLKSKGVKIPEYNSPA